MAVSEIEVLNNMIRLLNDCLKISKANNRTEEIKRTRKDIRTCNAELKRMLEQRGSVIAEAIVKAEMEKKDAAIK